MPAPVHCNFFSSARHGFDSVDSSGNRQPDENKNLFMQKNTSNHQYALSVPTKCPHENNTSQLCSYIHMHIYINMNVVMKDLQPSNTVGMTMPRRCRRRNSICSSLNISCSCLFCSCCRSCILPLKYILPIAVAAAVPMLACITGTA